MNDAATSSVTVNVADNLTQLTITPSTSKMIERIMANDDVFYRHEQRDAPDLTLQEKRKILETLYTSDPRLFMRRYHGYLAVEDCDCFDQEDYEIQFFINAVSERCRNAGKKKDVRLRNQRYAELQRLKKETDYFSDKKMREREPLLFDKMVGRFLPEEEQFFLRPTIENESLSGVFMQFEDSQIISNRRDAQLSEWNDFLKKGDSEEHGILKVGNLAQHASSRLCEEISSYGGKKNEKTRNGEKVSGSISEASSISKMEEQEMASASSEEDRDQEELRADFIDHMEQRFLRGDDAEFYDYSHVDNVLTKEYERMRDQDLEEAYFEND